MTVIWPLSNVCYDSLGKNKLKLKINIWVVTLFTFLCDYVLFWAIRRRYWVIRFIFSMIWFCFHLFNSSRKWYTWVTINILWNMLYSVLQSQKLSFHYCLLNIYINALYSLTRFMFSRLLNTTLMECFTFPEAPSPIITILSCLSGASSSESDILNKNQTI